MRRVPLREVSDQDGNDTIRWIDVIRQCIRRPLDPQRGVDVDEMRKGIRLLDALEACQGDLLELEDADWDHLVAKVKAMQWAVVDRRILLFIDDVTNAAEVSPNGHLSPQGIHA